MAGQGPAGLIGFAVKGIAGGIGLASEAVHHHKEKKKAKEQAALNPPNPGATLPRGDDALPPYTYEQGEINAYPRDEKSNPYGDKKGNPYGDKKKFVDYGDTFEDEWDLDDAQDELVRTPSSEEKEKSKPTQDIGQLTAIFLQNHPILQYMERLPLPVIIPQRRPKDRSRGFVRAYAPVLMNCNIDQTTWLEFIELFYKASQASPWLNAINLASLAGSVLPHGISMAVSIAVQIGVKIVMEMQSRQR
jgi:hypothetical protein